MATFGTSNTWIQDSDKFELYADDTGKVRFRPATGGPADPGPPKAESGIASVPSNTSDSTLVNPTEQRADPDADRDASG